MGVFKMCFLETTDGWIYFFNPHSQVSVYLLLSLTHLHLTLLYNIAIESWSLILIFAVCFFGWLDSLFFIFSPLLLEVCWFTVLDMMDSFIAIYWSNSLLIRLSLSLLLWLRLSYSSSVCSSPLSISAVLLWCSWNDSLRDCFKCSFFSANFKRYLLALEILIVSLYFQGLKYTISCFPAVLSC